MRALLVYPEYPNTFWNFKYALKFIARRAAYPPLGLLTVASMLPADWDLRLVDLNVRALRDEDLKRAELVCISAMSIQTRSAREVIARCVALGVPILAGGPLFTSTPDEFPEVDYLVLNEAEVTLPAFLRDFKRGTAQHCYTSSEHSDMRDTPGPRWDLIRTRDYASLSIQLTRGCPFDCDFCNITALFGRVPRLKNTAQILTELEAIYHLGWRRQVFFVDDNFIGNSNRVKHEVLPALIAWMKRHRYPFVFNTQLSINLADDPEMMALLARAGFSTAFVGIESPNDDSLTECNKIPNKGRDLIAGVKKIQQAGIQVQAGFIVGFDSDPASIFDRMTRFITESGIVTAMVGLLNAPHGTRLYQRMVDEGRLTNELTGDNTDCSMNFVPTMNVEALQQGYRRIVESLYSPNNYYARVKEFLRNFHPAKTSLPRGAVGPGLISGIKCAWTLGLRDRGRKQYWGLVFWALFTRPRLLPMAITLAAFGFHFRMCFAQY